MAFNKLNVSVSVDLQAGFAFGQGTDALAGFESIRGSNSADSLAGNNFDNRIEGLKGNDQLFGRDGIDRLLGGDGNDVLNGGNGGDIMQGDAGDDTLVGGGARDTLTGGAGLDIFKYSAIADSGTTSALRDLIADFSIGSDRINLADIDANTLVGGNQAFTFIGAGAFTATAGQLRAVASGGATVISGDINGDSTADFAIGLTGVLALTAADFIL